MLEPMVAMFGRKPILDRLFVQKAGHVFDLPVRAVAYNLPVALANLYGFENHMRLDHSPNMRPGPAVSSWIGCHNQTDPLPCQRRFGMRYAWNDAQFIGVR
jgi:hypothetical protein